MSWCDKLASTPVVGLRFALMHQSGDTLLDRLQPLFDTWVAGRKQQFSIEQQSSFGVQFITENGFRYSVDHEGVVVEFRHRYRIRSRSASVPVAELLSKARPYTELLDEAVDRVLQAVELVNGPSARILWRLGIMSNTALVIADAPPGIRRLIDYVGRPWGGNLPHFNFDITGPLEAKGDHSDRCIHSVGMADVENNAEKLIAVKLDWQRSYTIAKPSTIDVVKKHLIAGKTAALAYFEDVAEGSRFDEEILHKSARA